MELIGVDGDDVYDALVRARHVTPRVDYALVDHSDTSGPDGEIQREAMRLAVVAFAEVWGRNERDVDADAIPIERIGVDEFYGSLFDRKAGRLALPAWHRVPLKPVPGSDPTGPVALVPDLGPEPSPPPDGRQTHVGLWAWAGREDEPFGIPVEEWVVGYANAFVDPPYPLETPPLEVQELFLAIDHLFLGRPDEHSEIWRAKCTDLNPEGTWAPYFDWNWWMGYVWTVRTGPTRIAVIGASGTE